MAKMQYTIEERTALITLDDGKANAINWDFIRELNAALDRALADDAGALILTTGRPGIFGAGLDLKFMPALSPGDHYKFLSEFAETMIRLYLLPIPTIAAHAGHAIAGGALMSFACDRFIMADGPYRIQMNEALNKGMVIPSWIALICRSSIPQRWQREALLHARAYSPREAFERQIIDNLLAEGADVLAEAKSVAREFLKLNRRSYSITKNIILRQEAHRVLELYAEEYRESQAALGGHVLDIRPFQIKTDD